MLKLLSLLRTAALLICFAARCFAQADSPQPDTREAEIEQQRALKPSPPSIEPEEKRGLAKLADHFQTFTHWVPLRISVEGLGPGAGLTLSSNIQRQSRDGSVAFSLFGSAEMDAFYNVGTALEFPHFTTRDLTFRLQGVHSDSPQLEYYGPGPYSLERNRTNYRREDSIFSLDVVSQQYRHVSPGCSLSEALFNVGPGTNQDLPQTESVFSAAEAPGIDHQSDYWFAGCSVKMEWRDFPEDPHRGTYATAGYYRYGAQDDSRFSFHRFSGTAEQYIPFFNEMRVIALLARTDWSVHGSNQEVPFYMQPTLGSDTDLRGFRRYRFYDENAAALTAEYRWEVSTGFDFAIFGDAGEVFHAPGDFRLDAVQYSEGFGLRFKGPMKDVVVRLDTGFSKEGVRIWLKFAKQL